MGYILRHGAMGWFLAALVAFLLSACGTSERASESSNKSKPKEERTLSANPDTGDPSSEKAKPPPTRVLVSPAEAGAEAVERIEDGRASWYGPKFHGRLTANGEEYDMHALTAAHRTLPFNTLVLVRNRDNGREVTVRINDRGPFAKNRIIDLSKEAARKIKMVGPGTANVELYVAKNAVDPSKSVNLTTPTYTVQLGSFDTESKAFTHSSKIKGSRVEIVRLQDDTIYRVYYGLFIDKDKAYEKQQELERRNFSGFVKQIENG